MNTEYTDPKRGHGKSRKSEKADTNLLIDLCELLYTYNWNGDVVSKTDRADTYDFTYSSGLKVETVSLNGQELRKFGK
jgi:hypothetical protein